MKKILFSSSLILTLFLLGNIYIQAQTNEIKMEIKKTTKKVGSLIKVRPEYEERYIILHKYTFPGVLESIRKSNIRNYSIFLSDGMLFSYYEYAGNNYDEDMKAMADPTIKDWWKLTDPMQEPIPTRKDGEWWATMEEILTFNNTLKTSVNAQRIALSAEVIPGKEEELKRLCKNAAGGLEEATNNENFQNCHLFLKDGKIYYYYEYVGDNIRQSLKQINNNGIFQTFQTNMNKYLISKDFGYWQVMKEVFHID